MPRRPDRLRQRAKRLRRLIDTPDLPCDITVAERNTWIRRGMLSQPVTTWLKTRTPEHFNDRCCDDCSLRYAMTMALDGRCRVGGLTLIARAQALRGDAP